MRTDEEEQETLLRQLLDGPAYEFAHWPNTHVPKVAAGVYTIWQGDRLIYVGMSGRGMKDTDTEAPDEPRKAKGLFTRLKSHANGRRSGDQFCVYVCDRLIVPDLTRAQQEQIRDGKLLLDDLTKRHILKEFKYRYVKTKDGQEAFDLEREIQKNGLGGKLPELNPAKTRTTRS
jgi:hypothetical protein